MHVLTVVGARPQFVKAWVVSRALRRSHRETLLHTGQHYDRRMSRLFFDELGLPEPDVNLGVGSASHATQTGEILIGVEREVAARQPDWVLVFGDTNSTFAAALAAAKLHVPVAHVEAGLRSFNRRMPEEMNRILTDHIADLLLCPTSTAVEHLAREGVAGGVHLVGDVMLDAVQSALATMNGRGGLDGLPVGTYYYATVHRAENTDDPIRLAAIVEAFGRLDRPVVWPVHPRTRQMLTDLPAPPQNVRLAEPFSYRESLAAQRAAAAVLTDSGGIQKEAYMLGTPCVTLRDDTEWVETVATGWNQLVGADTDRILAAARARPPAERPSLYGDGRASERIVELLEAGQS
jgi:UDP-N-acetylglucosamine 2-epimerase